MTTKEAIKIWEDLFANKTVTTYREQNINRTMQGGGKLRAFRIKVNGMWMNFTEQNKAKASPPAARARSGAKIMWIIPPKGSWWRVEDGKLYKSNETTPGP